MQTKQIYYEDQYKKKSTARIVSIEINVSTASIILDRTVFYPEGGGQPSDQGVIKGINGQLEVQQVLVKNGEIVHLGKISGSLKQDDTVECLLVWERRYKNMRVHSAGHVVHDAAMSLFPDLIPIEGEHGKRPYIEYKGHLDQVSANLIAQKANEIVKDDLPIKTEFVTLEQLKERSPWIPENLPKNKPLRIMQIGNFSPIPDGGTQLNRTGEILGINSVEIQNNGENTLVFYKILQQPNQEKEILQEQTQTGPNNSFVNNDILNLKNQAVARISSSASIEELEEIRIDLLGRQGKLTSLMKRIKEVPAEERAQVGITLNEAKQTVEDLLNQQKNNFKETARVWFDPTIPGILPKIGHTHLVTQAIREITEVFKEIGFRRARYPEVEWDYYAFEGLNMPKGHPARDEWETFFVDAPENSKFGKMVLTPHTSSGQVREMLRIKTPPVRMINIAKCYRRQSDASHVPMFHQFEGLAIDEGISIVNLKGTLDYFARSFFGPERKTRLRPYHFQFTEPSFEIDITCGICNGKGCKVCKAGWLEMGGAGMVHPNVLKAGGINPKKYSGFAFGWGVERVLMMRSGLSIPDVRLLYSPDLRFLSQF